MYFNAHIVAFVHTHTHTVSTSTYRCKLIECSHLFIDKHTHFTAITPVPGGSSVMLSGYQVCEGSSSCKCISQIFLCGVYFSVNECHAFGVPGMRGEQLLQLYLTNILVWGIFLSMSFWIWAFPIKR